MDTNITKFLVLLFLVISFDCVALGTSDRKIESKGNVNLLPSAKTFTNKPINLEEQNAVRFEDLAGGQYVGLKAPLSVATSFDFLLPSSDGAASQCLKTDGSFGLSFGDCSDYIATDDNRLLKSNTGSGADVQESGIVVSDNNDLTGVASLTTASATINGGFAVISTSTPSIPAPVADQSQIDLMSPLVGSQSFNSTTNKLNVYDGTDWVEVGAGGEGVGDLDVFYSETFEVNDLSLWTTGNSATPFSSGTIAGTTQISTASPIAGDNTYLYTQAGAGSDSDWSAAPVITLERKQKGAWITFSGTYEYDGADDDMTLYAYTDLSTTVPIAELQLDTATNSNRFQMTGYVPATAATLQFGHFTSVFNANKELKLDDLDWATNKFPETNITNVKRILARGNAGQAITSDVTNIPFIEISDSGNNFDGTTITIDRDNTDVYISGSVLWTSNIQTLVYIYKNGAFFAGTGSTSTNDSADFNYNGKFDAGDTITFRQGGVSSTLVNSVTSHYLSVTMVNQNETVLSPTDNIFPVRYEAGSAQTIEHNTDTVVQFNNKTTGFSDPDGYVTTGAGWRYTAKRNGQYKVRAVVRFSNTTSVHVSYIRLFRNNIAYNFLDIKTPKDTTAADNDLSLSGEDVIYLEKGQYIDIRVFQNRGSDLNLSGDDTTNYISIEAMDKVALASFPTKNPRCNLMVTGTNWTTTKATGKFSQDREGQWYADINVFGALSIGGASAATYPLTFTGLSWDGRQTIMASQNTDSALNTTYSLSDATGNIYRVRYSSAVTSIALNGELRLAAKPNISGCDL